ncbi:hypothetical protein FCU45_08430 [Sulfurimonas crateris]|uniref:DUF3971 domain-containing protein n=1 Tax=Sulfurimonas crateris TaxID=2574727 RepID=A0A4U2Z4B8_9BACT|nr:hypothetical protein [Sulfurimonas crateris]TKI68978.1 hypothetical protein FCU45_08430 [Sulfurimonas crateris]
MKFLAWIGAILAVVVATLYIAAFSKMGNGFVKPFIEAKIKEQTKLESKLNEFRLDISDFEIVLEVNRGNIIRAKGEYSLFAKSFDISYDVELKDLSSLKPLTKTELRGAFATDGRVYGDMAFMKIDGKSSVAKSDTAYHIELHELNPTSIIANIKGAELASLLYMSAQNPCATAGIDMDLNFRDITPNKMDGEVVLKSRDGKIDPKYMLSDFNVTIPKTSFSMDLNAKLKGDEIEYSSSLLSNLFNINSYGTIVPEPLKTDLKYSLNIEDLEVLKPITKADIRGSLKLSGSAKGGRERLSVAGISDIASSESVFEAILKDFAPASIKAKIVDLDIAKLLYMAKQPHYTDGVLSMNVDISDARADSLSGKVDTIVTKGVLDSKYLSKTYEFASTMPKTLFSLKAETLLEGDIADTKAKLSSNIAGLEMKSAKFNMKDGSLKSDYKLSVPDLNALFFVTKRHIRGSLAAYGDISKSKDLDLTFNSNIAKGKVAAKLHNDEFHADVSSVSANAVLHMFFYPEIADAWLNAKVDYNLAQSRGSMKAQVSDAVFVKNQTFDLIKQYTKVDMYREHFNGDMDAKVDKDSVLASIDLRSKEASIKTAATKLNTKTNMIDTDITLRAKKNEISGRLVGDIDSPKIVIDLEKFMKSEAGKKVEEKVNKVIEKEINKFFKKLF